MGGWVKLWRNNSIRNLTHKLAHEISVFERYHFWFYFIKPHFNFETFHFSQYKYLLIK